ncbi:hypothetical protein [Roseovarius sp. D22-M7]|uniref:hypothetical protein n=1 Tax=Roseovarius sp. D22-M7 TaxID=3127116 RepID=UPI00300F8BF8
MSLVSRAPRRLSFPSMEPLRAITACGLCLFLALTSVTLAVARAAPLPAGEIVICGGDGSRSVPVDASGAPIDPPHACPDCLLAFYATEPRDPLPVPRMAVATARHPFADATHPIPLSRPAMLARAPPAPV